MSGHQGSTRRDISHNAFDGDTRIHQGDVHNNYYSPPRPMPHAGVVRVIPYPRNEDLVYRQDLMKRLDDLLQSTQESCSVALWGLGGSGKTQIALNYAYRRCNTDPECCVFWVHAESEATFSADYKTIGNKLGIDDTLNGTMLLDAVRIAIEERPNWLMVIDNADNLSLFGVGRHAQVEEDTERKDQNLRGYIPCSSQGMILWTSRDGHIVGTLVGARRGIVVQSMAMNEARDLLETILEIPSTGPETSSDTGINDLLEELQYLPLAISQAGAYMKRLSMTAKEYLGCLNQGKSRWDVLKISDTDRYRRPEVSNSVLETWKISTEQIRTESHMSYHILHVIAYVDNQDIPLELLAAAASSFLLDDEDHEDDENSIIQIPELEVLQAVARLEEFSFLSLRRTDDGERRYEMHKLVQEAVRYDLRIRSLLENTTCNRPESLETFYSAKALRVVDSLFPKIWSPTSWAQCERYVTHAVRMGEWVEISGTDIQTADLLENVSNFFNARGRWSEAELLFDRVLGLRRDVLGTNHLDTIRAMSNVALMHGNHGRYDKARVIVQEVLELRQQLLGDEHPDTIKSMTYLGWFLLLIGDYDEAEVLQERALKLQCRVLGEKHPDTIETMNGLGSTYLAQNRLEEAQKSMSKALELFKEVMGLEDLSTINTMMLLGEIYTWQGQYKDGEVMLIEAMSLRKEVLGEKHPETIRSMISLARSYGLQARYHDAESLYQTTLDLGRQVLEDSHPYMVFLMEKLAFVREKLQQRSSGAEPVGPFSMNGMKGGKEGFRLLLEVMRQKVGNLRISRSSRGQGG